MGMKEAISLLEKEYGGNILVKLNEGGLDVETISTGNIALDVALGVGGLPKGRIVEIFGPESSGKTTVALHVVAEAQRQGFECVFIDVEHALDPIYAAAIGVDLNKVYISQPSYAEQALDVALRVIQSGEVGVVVIDSVAALSPRAEIEGDMGDSHMGLAARLMGQALRRINSEASKYGTIVIFINQIREKLGVVFGSNETTPGGRALKFFASVRLDVRRIGQLKNGSDIIGNETKIKVVKNKVAPPFKEALIDIVYGEGMSNEAALLSLAEKHGLVKRSGAWYADPETGEKIGQGREQVRRYIIGNPDFARKLRDSILTLEGIQDGTI